MTDFDDVLVSVDGPIRTVTLNRPEKRNALSVEMLEHATAAFSNRPGGDERVAVIRSVGTVFCAGIDLKQRLESPPPGTESPVEGLFAAVEEWPLPVVAVVQGDAIAGGNELALHSDLVIASTKANFGMSLAQIGLAPTWFLAKKLLEVAGPVVTREILLMGDPLPAARLHELGVISRVVSPHRLQAEADAVIGRLAANAPLSLRAIKALINREMAFRDEIEHNDVDELVAAARDSEDARVGIAARLAGDVVDFQGR